MARDMQIGRDCLGHHHLLELYGCPESLLGSVDYVTAMMDRVAKAGKCNVLDNHYHQFQPYGVSGATIIEESHLTIHTWPEHGYAAVDLFFCSDAVCIEAMVDELRSGFEPQDIERSVHHRGSRAVGELLIAGG